MVLGYFTVRRNNLKPNSRSRRPYRKQEEKHFVNSRIRAREVRCIDDEGNHNIMDTAKAIVLAEQRQLDLVQISTGRDEIPTCKIMDYSKFKYEQSKKEKAAKKKQRENSVKIKEIKFRPSTGDHDLQTKAKHAQEFLNEGNKLKVTVVFRGRELAYKDIGKETLDKFIGFLNQASYECAPSMSGRFMSAMIIKKAESNPS